MKNTQNTYNASLLGYDGFCDDCGQEIEHCTCSHIETVEEKRARLYAEVEAHTPGYITSRQQAKVEREARYAAKMQAILEEGARVEAEIVRLS